MNYSGKIAASLSYSSPDLVLEKGKLAIEKGAHILENRIDGLENHDFSYLSENIDRFANFERSIPKILTIRHSSESGRPDGGFRGTEEERMSLYRLGMEKGFSYIDIELEKYDGSFEKRNGTQLVLSNHNFKLTPDNETLLCILERMQTYRPDKMKLAMKAERMIDGIRLFEFTKTNQPSVENKLISMSMGEPGFITRQKAPEIFCEWAYACVEDGEQVAPGQVSIDRLKTLWAAEGYTFN